MGPLWYHLFGCEKKMKKYERKLELLGEGILARGIDGSVMNYDGFWRSFRQFDWEDGKVGE